MPELATAPVTEVKQSRPDFGHGRYSPLMSEIYDSSMTVFQLKSDKAEKLAHTIANELGAIMANRPVEIKLGKVNKDGKLTIAEAAKLKGFTMTKPIATLRALFYADEAGKNGFSYGHTKWQPVQWLSEYLSEL